MRKTSKILLNAVTATGAGSEIVNATDNSRFTFYIKASGVTSGCTLEIQAKSPVDDWHRVGSAITVNANGNTVQQIEGAFKELRANITARTDGTFTVSVDAQGDR